MTIGIRLPTPIGLLRRGHGVSTAVVNAWEAMVDDTDRRAERDRLAAGNDPAGPGSRLEAIDADGCWRLLQTTSLGRVGFTAHSGQPVILPVNYAVVDRRILIRTARGPKLEAARRGEVVAFEADQIDAERHDGWSVTLTGRSRWINDAREAAALESKAPETWASGRRRELILIEPVHVGGRWMRARAAYDLESGRVAR